MKPSRVRTPGGKKTPSRNNSRERLVIRDPVEVYCRLRPVSVSDEGYIKVIDSNTLQLATPDNSLGRRGGYKEIQYKFSRVFDESSTQKDVFTKVGMPLVESLLRGRNGLLFTYGVTGSGKTFTMTGTPRDQGVLPRCLDVLFNSIAGYQARKFVFKPDRMNGFEVQSDADAARDRQRELLSENTQRVTRQDYPKTPRRRLEQWEGSSRNAETSRLGIQDEDTVYTVFVTYVEIYNNCVFDLLDEPADDAARFKAPQPRVVREDANHNMYAHGVVEVEVTTAEEAFEVFRRGLRRKTMGQTVLNAESSRSHAVFTLRLVQAPLDRDGEEVVRDKSAIIVSQLSLVDLAGSERTNRSKTQGAQLREASNINNSLLTLRMCFEMLRDNQANAGNGPPKLVPFRDSRLTHFFKNYFDGEGQVRMVVCVNPNPNDYEETLHVMKFAEMSQEVQVTRPTPKKIDLGLTPGRRRANQVFKEAVRRLEENGDAGIASLPLDLGIVYSLGLVLPTCQLTDPHNEEVLRPLMAVLEQRAASRIAFQEQLKVKQSQVRAVLVSQENEMAQLRLEASQLRQESACLRASLENDRTSRSGLEQRLVQSEGELVAARLQLEAEREENRRLRTELDDTELKLTQRRLDSERTRQRMQDKIAAERDKVSREMRHRMMAHQNDLKTEIERKAEKLRQVQQIVTSDGEAPSTAGPPTRGRVTRLAQARSEAELRSSSTSAFCTPARGHHQATPTPSRRLARSAVGAKGEGDRLKVVPALTPCDLNLSSKAQIISNNLAKKIEVASNNLAKKIQVTSNTLAEKKTLVTETVAKLSKSITPRSLRGPAVSNPRHRRSRSAGNGELWLDHRPGTVQARLLELNTLMQPDMKRRKSVSKLTDPRDVTDPNTSKYCLTTQEQDSAGELETKLYKGDVLPTVGGGAQVVLTDVEILRQESPTRLSPPRKRSAENIPRLNLEDVAERCKGGIEGHKRPRK